jgi:hypothetical protein
MVDELLRKGLDRVIGSNAFGERREREREKFFRVLYYRRRYESVMSYVLKEWVFPPR